MKLKAQACINSGIFDGILIDNLTLLNEDGVADKIIKSIREAVVG